MTELLLRNKILQRIFLYLNVTENPDIIRKHEEMIEPYS